MLPIPYPLINKPIPAKNKTYAYVKAAVDSFAFQPKYSAVVLQMGGAAGLTMTILTILKSKAQITGGEVLAKLQVEAQVMKMLLLHKNLVCEAVIKMLTKLA